LLTPLPAFSAVIDYGLNAQRYHTDMIRIGQRQFEVPLWLWVAVPLVSAIYAVSGANVLLPRFGVPDETFFLIVRRCATAALTGFLIADLARRTRVPWYDLIIRVWRALQHRRCRSTC
jgi:hypothetical protein